VIEYCLVRLFFGCITDRVLGVILDSPSDRPSAMNEKKMEASSFNSLVMSGY